MTTTAEQPKDDKTMKASQQSGVVTIEASLALLIFIPAILSIMTIATILSTQIRVQQALNQSVKDIARYYYTLTRAGVNLSSPSEMDNSRLDGVVNNLEAFYDSLKSGAEYAENFSDELGQSIPTEDQGLESVKESLQKLKNTANDINTIRSTIQLSFNSTAAALALADDPVKIIKTLALTVGSDVMSHGVAAAMGRAMFIQYIQAGSERSADDILKAIGVVDGLDGMNFWGSSLLEDGQSVNVSVVYRIKPPFAIKYLDNYKVRQVASTQAWMYRPQE